jgi:Holliday junction resolvasome RuvABC endonuclease subunit
VSEIAFDLSLVESGWSTGEYSGVIKPGKIRGHERLEMITAQVLSLTCDLEEPVVFMEGFSFGSQGKGVVERAGLAYLVRHSLWRLGISYCLVPPKSLKKYATGRGDCGKDEMIGAAIRRFGYEGVSNNNAVDAFLLWHCAQEHLGRPLVQVPVVQAEQAHNKLEWVRP